MIDAVPVQLQEYLKVRMEFGVRRYGTPLLAWNGRDFLLDAFEEAVDLALYLAQGLIERDGALPGPERYE